MPGQKLGQVVKEEPSKHSRGLIFSLIIKKLGQNVGPNKIFDEFENGSCQVKNWARAYKAWVHTQLSLCSNFKVLFILMTLWKIKFKTLIW